MTGAALGSGDTAGDKRDKNSVWLVCRENEELLCERFPYGNREREKKGKREGLLKM